MAILQDFKDAFGKLVAVIEAPPPTVIDQGAIDAAVAVVTTAAAADMDVAVGMVNDETAKRSNPVPA